MHRFGKTPTLRVKLTRDHLSAHRRHHPERKDLHADPRPFVQRPRCGALFCSCSRARSQVTCWSFGMVPRFHRCQAVKGLLGKKVEPNVFISNACLAMLQKLNPQERGLEICSSGSNSRMFCCLEVHHIQTQLRRAKERLRHRSLCPSPSVSAHCWLFSLVLSAQINRYTTRSRSGLFLLPIMRMKICLHGYNATERL